MASKAFLRPWRHLLPDSSGYLRRSAYCAKITAQTTSRCLTTDAYDSEPHFESLVRKFQDDSAAAAIQKSIPSHLVAPEVITTVYSFPEMRPLHFASYPANLLRVPLRRDILHSAVVYEGSMTRVGTASAKWRSDVHGSGAKIRPQKGTGMARLGDRKSPMLRGGGKAHGPVPRDFSIGLPKKVYDLAWRIALSYRYRRGQLVVVDKLGEPEDDRVLYLDEIFGQNRWGKGEGRSVVITKDDQEPWSRLFESAGRHGILRSCATVDVKNLLEMGRLIVEQDALDTILAEHQSDLVGPRGMPLIEEPEPEPC